MKALELISKVNEGDLKPLKDNFWLKCLWLKDSKEGINVENYEQADLDPHEVLNYVERTLRILDAEILNGNLTELEASIIEEVLCFAEIAKGGNKVIRSKWREKCYQIDVHNIGSSQIYDEVKRDSNDYRRYRYISTLIKTHGLIGQFLRGEVSLYESAPLSVTSYPGASNERVLKVLNKCIIGAVSMDLYEKLKNDINKTVDDILNFRFIDYTDNRLKKIRATAIKNGEDFDKEFSNIVRRTPSFKDILDEFFKSYDLWYVEVATSELSLENVLKLFAYIAKNTSIYEVTNISFENMMSFYCDYDGKKHINIFKHRFIERLLSDYDLSSDKKIANEFLSIELEVLSPMLKVKVKFSEIAEKFVDFCMSSIGKGSIYDQVIVMACDNFGLRRDQFDRLTNESSYLDTMNSTIAFKLPLIDYIKGDKVADIGPGGGALMDKIVEAYPDKKVIGVDAAINVVEELNKKRTKENKSWEVVHGNALNLQKTFAPGELDTVIFCSILHEIYSYVDYEGKKFNKATLAKVFKSVYDILPVGGRMIIRDGVMTDSNEKRIISFKNKEDIKILENYKRDFKGRQIEYKILENGNVLMSVNDAMEFLYTYTWGEQSYAHEVKEQFGYYTPNEYIEAIKSAFDNKMKVVHMDHYLQDGYEEYLLPKVSIYDENENECKLPDSTIILIVEKTE